MEGWQSTRVRPKQPVWCEHRPVEALGTFVPFSILSRPNTFVREQFWGRAARASLTRKSRETPV